jgi:uncharacterized protein YjbI with pentapeptide repeats
MLGSALLSSAVLGSAPLRYACFARLCSALLRYAKLSLACSVALRFAKLRFTGPCFAKLGYACFASLCWACFALLSYARLSSAELSSAEPAFYSERPPPLACRCAAVRTPGSDSNL